MLSKIRNWFEPIWTRIRISSSRIEGLLAWFAIAVGFTSWTQRYTGVSGITEIGKVFTANRDEWNFINDATGWTITVSSFYWFWTAVTIVAGVALLRFILFGTKSQSDTEGIMAKLEEINQNLQGNGRRIEESINKLTEGINEIRLDMEERNDQTKKANSSKESLSDKEKV